ncbi:hypothetical protein DY000_02049845 [Brassica cretica]|uniref:F-box domain-containing protein n=1 Tax=Brassica cretica TaxID=69181 RepID=A0ABQ7F6M7_BRACR|nr:hypothetical protein DY000_02049846 [Brassica cretica]KAF3611604.1 hypothetical protein DY000_02049845 [Brassica cretica]
MTRISDLSQDLIEEILSRVPLTCQRAVLSTCKQWNSLYKDEIFTKKHRGKAANDTVVCDSRPFTGMSWIFLRCGYGSFFVDEKKKVALIWDKHYPKAYLIGEGNYFKVAALGNSIYYWAVVCSYVQSSVPIQKGPVHAGG